MSRGLAAGRSGTSLGSMMIVLGSLCLAVALAWPTWRARAFDSRVQQAVADIETLRTAAEGIRADLGRWPTASPPREAPPELSALGGGGPFGRPAYALQWTTWELVDSVEARVSQDVAASDDAPRESVQPMAPVVRSVGAVVVGSSDEGLLSELLGRYAAEHPFLLDTAFVLVLPERGPALVPR